MIHPHHLLNFELNLVYLSSVEFSLTVLLQTTPYYCSKYYQGHQQQRFFRQIIHRADASKSRAATSRLAVIL
jgi:hypothetical protein